MLYKVNDYTVVKFLKENDWQELDLFLKNKEDEKYTIYIMDLKVKILKNDNKGVINVRVDLILADDTEKETYLAFINIPLKSSNYFDFKGNKLNDVELGEMLTEKFKKVPSGKEHIKLKNKYEIDLFTGRNAKGLFKRRLKEGIDASKIDYNTDKLPTEVFKDMCDLSYWYENTKSETRKERYSTLKYKFKRVTGNMNNGGKNNLKTGFVRHIPFMYLEDKNKDSIQRVIITPLTAYVGVLDGKDTKYRRLYNLNTQTNKAALESVNSLVFSEKELLITLLKNMNLKTQYFS